MCKNQIKTSSDFDYMKHWKNIDQTKCLKDVSWFQPTPAIFLDFFKQFNVPRSAKIIVHQV